MINARQFEQLKEMGIPLYQKRVHNSHGTSSSGSITLDFSDIENDAFFQDVLMCMSLSLGEITIKTSSIDLGLFNWCFHEQDTIEFKEHTLVTPPLVKLKESPSLKKSLWHTIYKNL
jgi:hypothetical protein